jgi:transcriptional regulator with XRE-family HTH domain
VPSALHRRIAASIREQTQRQNLSFNKLADFAGISRRQLSRVLSCEQSPTIATLEKIAAALDVGVRDLLPPSA